MTPRDVDGEVVECPGCKMPTPCDPNHRYPPHTSPIQCVVALRSRVDELERQLLPKAVETPALDELLNSDTVVIKDADIDARIALKDRSRLELSRLKSRPKVSVEEAERVFLSAWCNAFRVSEEGREINDYDRAALRAVLALCEGSGYAMQVVRLDQ